MRIRKSGRPGDEAPTSQDKIHLVVRPGLVAHVDGRLQFHRIVGQWVLGVLQVGDHVVRGSAREAFDVRILDDRLVELRERYVDQRKAPASAVHLQMAGTPLTSGLLGQE